MRKNTSAEQKAKVLVSDVVSTESLVDVLRNRFAQYPHRHRGLNWKDVEKRLRSTAATKLASLMEMERTGGEPDVVAYDKKTDEYVFFDCAPESPKGRRSVCYDEAARLARKENRPEASALGMAAAMGVTMLTEAEYQQLQKLGEFDLKTSSWIQTPAAVRDLGGALFGDRRYNHVFTYHNGADSYYAARGFRARLRI